MTSQGVNVGDRIELVYMGADPDPIPPGTKGTVIHISRTPVQGETQLSVNWDNGRRLAVLLPEDTIRVLDKE